VSILGNLGLGFGPSGGAVCDYPVAGNVRQGVTYGEGEYTGTLVLPAASNVRQGVGYGTLGVEFTGTILIPPTGKVLLGYNYGAAGTEYTGSLAAPTPRPEPSTVVYANQGVTLMDLINAFRRLMGLTMDFQLSADGTTYRDVVYWEHPSKVQDTGRQRQVWFKLHEEGIFPSDGPGRWGNRVDVKFQVGLVTRGFADGTQRDIRRAVYHYTYRARFTDAVKGKNLFYLYQTQPVDPEVWTPPYPVADEVPLTVAPMMIDSAPGPVKTQVEEGTNETTWIVTLPCVLLLTLPTAAEP